MFFRRVSKSGKFGGSQGHIFGNMTPGPPMELLNRKDTDDDDEDDDDDEEDEMMLGRADSRTPESLQDDDDDVDDVEASNVLASYSTFKAEANKAAQQAASSGRRGTRAGMPQPGEGASSCEELYAGLEPEPSGGGEFFKG